MSFRLTLVALSAMSLVGCASVNSMAPKAAARADAAVKAFENSANARASVREIHTPMSDFTRTSVPRVKGDVRLRAAGVPFAPVLAELGKQAGYSVAFADNVDASRKVTVNFNDALTEDAIRTTAFLAGYVAVIDKNQRTIMVADTATYTYRLPASLFSQLQAEYNVGGNPANAGSGGGGSGGGGGGTSLRAEFSVSGREGTTPAGVTRFLTDIAGRGSEVFVSETGHVSVKGSAQSLRRVTDFMKGFAKEAMTQVEIEASVIEVTLANDFALGIQWGKVVDRASGGVQGALIGGGASGAVLGAAATGATTDLLGAVSSGGVRGGFSTFRVSNSSSALIDALAQFTDVNIVSQPKLLSMNNVPATFFDGTQLPYLGSVQQTASATVGGEPTVSGSVAFAIDGVSFSAIPSVVNGNTVQITLIPVLSSVNRFETFLGGTLTAPVQGNKQTYMRVLAESGKTLILGGIRYNKESKDIRAPSGVSKSSNSKEVVILLRANVIEAPAFDPVVSESL
jgi:MSHA biogenesis protein MshL